MTALRSGSATQGRLDEVLVTPTLGQRKTRHPSHAADDHARRVLVATLGSSSEVMLQAVADEALRLCDAQSAGVSLLVEGPGDDVFERRAIAGAWAGHAHSSAPRSFSPYGVVVDDNKAHLFHRPERYYRYLQEAHPAVVEALLVPFHTNGKTIGALWAVQHDESRLFDAEDMRRLTTFAACASAVHQVIISVSRLNEGGLGGDELSQDLFRLGGVLQAAAVTAPRVQRAADGRLGLSRREYEVVCLVAQGHTNKAIADMLGVNVKTIETYRARATDKLGFRNRADFVSYALINGWL